ncbi:S1 family peptidase [Acinetobacter lwoffii]|uniref:S1 family peptidase n=1 Tax=Acinetobacter lwoffii TaxID=28090 RepID=UPI0012DE3688|nr:serine protease [Acinetobacter lwoffii]QGR75582.1 serine protease [Acinetobacter lwoffii]
MREYLADKLYYSTVRIDGNNSTGTGFFYIYDFGGLSKVFLVTNRHVIEPNQVGTINFHSAKDLYPNNGLNIGKRVTVNLNQAEWQQRWKFHPDKNIDIAILDFTIIEHDLDQKKMHVYYKALHSNTLISSDDYPDISSIQQVVYVGYPQGLIDNHNLLPIARSGYTASPIKFDFDGQKQFLIDSAVYPGSSGSPVCILNEGTPFVDRNNALHMDKTRFIFLGVLTSVRTERLASNPNEVKHYLNLGHVVKGECINEVIIHYFTVQQTSVNGRITT